MDYQNLVRDFALRTRENLETIRKIPRLHPDYEVYEVTQLLNSMLGLLVFPQQRYFLTIPAIPLNELEKQGWPVPIIQGEYPQVDDLRMLIRYIRNAISHFNIRFEVDANSQINGLIVWNEDLHRREKTWQAKLSIEDLEKITNKFIDLILE